MNLSVMWSRRTVDGRCSFRLDVRALFHVEAPASSGPLLSSSPRTYRNSWRINVPRLTDGAARTHRIHLYWIW